jgi:protein import protein ZIM17
MFLKYKYYDSFNLDSEQANPKTTESRRGGAIELSDINTNIKHGERESFTDIPGTTNTKAKTLAIIYTCKVCNTRSAKQFTEQAYKHGVVLVKCPGCQNHHLIADRLGWFEDRGVDGKGWDVEKLLTEVGENVKAVSGNDVLELTLDDIAGTKTEG